MKAYLKHGNFPYENIKLSIGGSKSKSNRLLILQAQFPNIEIENLSESDDTKVLQKGLKIEKGVVDVHHAGTAMRFLTAYFAAKEGTEITITGSQRMQERPIGILVDALKSLGADISYLKKEGFPPLQIKGKKLQQGTVKVKANVSSQYISALMLVAPILPHGLQIFLEGKPTSVSYIQMTRSLLEQIGIQTRFTNNQIAIPSTEKIKNTTLNVESDWSSASYFYSLTALSENCEMQLGNFFKESYQGDIELVKIFESLGVDTFFYESEKTISLSKKLNFQIPDSLQLDLSETPDLAQTIAVCCFGLGISCKLTGLHTLKIKETDRLSALKNELQKLGATILVTDDSLYLEKRENIKSNVCVETYQDHRMAMAFAPLSLVMDLTINEAEVVSKSYPGFWEDLKKTGIFCTMESI